MTVDIGTRITVFRAKDDSWYKGTVTARQGEAEVLVKYGDGDIDWVDLSCNRYRVSSSENFTKEETLQLGKQKQKIARLKVGSRVAVYWPVERAYFSGTVAQQPNSEERQQLFHFQINYDDGDHQIHNLLHTNFKNMPEKANRLKVGSRVSVKYNDRHYAGTVRKIKLHSSLPHRVEFDEADRKKEWLNLFVRPFLHIDESKEGDTVTSTTLVKRKRDFYFRHDKEEQPHKKSRQQKEDTSYAEKKILVCQELCGLCKNVANRVRVMSCFHLFCKSCIKEHWVVGAKNVRCPLCKIKTLGRLGKFDPDLDAFRAVEALDKTTLEVVQSFSSPAEASRKVHACHPSQVVSSCNSKRREDREYKGYYWRFKGSKGRILRNGENIKDGYAVEQIDMATGEVVAEFESMRKASEETGVSRGSIQRIIRREGKAHHKGFFWRLRGDTHGPWPDPVRPKVEPVEQLDFRTGDVLKSYESLSDARKALGMKANPKCIRDVCNGLVGRATAKGFFWRWKGSTRLPNHLMGVQKVIQIRRKKHGVVLREFRTSREAQRYFGFQCCWSTICRYCRNEEFSDGFYWRYRMLQPKIPEKEAIGRRLRVRQSDGEWLEGRVTTFDRVLKKHEITYDKGLVENHALGDIEYEWKNDHGQKPVEKLDLKTGEVLCCYESVMEAAQAVCGTPSPISAVCTGRYKSSYGYFWRYKGSDTLPTQEKQYRRVQQLCLKSGRVIQTFDTIAEAGRSAGVTTPGISYCCNGRNGSKSAGGYGWKFEADVT